MPLSYEAGARHILSIVSEWVVPYQDDPVLLKFLGFFSRSLGLVVGRLEVLACDEDLRNPPR